MSRKNLSSQGVTRPSNTSDRFEATRKPVTERSPIGFGASQQIGSYGGYDIRASAKVDIEDLINNKLKVDIDIAQRKIDAGVNLGSEKVVGGGVGIKASIDEKGRVNIEQVSAEIGAAGFGIGASIGANSSAASASAFGVKIEIGRDETGVSAKICYSVGVGEVCTEIKPREPGTSPAPAPAPAPAPGEFPIGTNRVCWIAYNVVSAYSESTFPAWGEIEIRELTRSIVGRAPQWNNEYPRWEYEQTYTYYLRYKSNGQEVPGSRYTSVSTKPSYAGWQRNNSIYRLPNGRSVEWNQVAVSGREDDIYEFLRSVMNGNFPQKVSQGIYWSNTYAGFTRVSFADGICYVGNTTQPPSSPPPPLSPQRYIDIPNPPIKYMTCNCCSEIKEIHKFLGIEKLKKHKFKIAKQFLAPGGKGTEDAEDYYAITQALFRMLANGLILNPKSKPLGSEWQNTNATAWASAMYEMMAETMSDGNSSQRFEIHAMMQLVQMMSAIAETSRKVEFIADGLGFEPNLIPEELPVLFTIHESHKGFGKKEPKKINVSGAKTDNEVEAILGKMLNPSKIPIVKWQFKPGEISIKEALNG